MLRHEVVWEDGAARASEARHALRALLDRAPHTGRAAVPEALRLDAELVVSELVTNAARHAPGPCGLVLRLSDGELTIAVWDTSAEVPKMREADPARVGGHGLRVIHTVSDRVVTAPYGGGKRIVVHFALPAEPGAGRSEGAALPAPSRA
ncbi:ATP-binding protein [Streptomyces bikiniensis]|uniref:ATP-binding protein n=1 Tax=Streptomyces bikiniensis TaxID=1896 RepID=UPI00068F2A85|nr:ATP-binding protein [Streptomyces bikiniensis]